MRSKLLALASAQGRQYGVVVRQLAGANSVSAADGPQEFIAQMIAQQQGGSGGGPVARGMRAAKVYVDGHEEPMRGAEIFDLATNSFKEIVAASRTRTVREESFAPGGNSFMSSGGSGTVTYQVPSLLFANLTIRKPRGSTPTLPVVAPPR